MQFFRTGSRGCRMCNWLTVIALVVAAFIAPACAVAADGIYSNAALQREAPRLRRAVERILSEGLMPAVSADEKRQLAGVRLIYPMPKPNDAVLNFYAGYVDNQPTVVLPLQSLKLVEDLMTAFAWTYETRRSFGAIDMYFAMLQRRIPGDLGAHGSRDILSVLGAPADVLANKGIDRLSLSLRNEAFAFILAHELGHLVYKHKGTDRISPAQARADEVQSDAFALDVLGRTGTPPMGAMVFFQAQIFSMPHRGQFGTRKEWQTYLETAATHPLSVERIQAMAAMMSGPLAEKRPGERAVWRDIGRRVGQLSQVLADVELHNCMAKVAAFAPVALLRQAEQFERDAIVGNCKRN